MKRKGAQGLPAGQRLTPAANDEFASMASGLERLEARPGWDPYEVWRTRVKGSSRAKRDPLR
jgi:hypothetical protein